MAKAQRSKSTQRRTKEQVRRKNTDSKFEPIKIQTNNSGVIEIKWLGHSSFQIYSVKTAKSIITDPYMIKNKHMKTTIAFTISHNADNHNNIPKNSSARIIQSAGEYEFENFAIRAIMSPLSAGQTIQERNIVYNISVENINICHMGNIEQLLLPQQIDFLNPVDILLCSHNDNNQLLSYNDIKQIGQQLNAKIIIPMHYPAQQMPELFLQDAGLSIDNITSQNKLRLSSNTIPDTLKIEVLKPEFSTYNLLNQTTEKINTQNTDDKTLASLFRF